MNAAALCKYALFILKAFNDTIAVLVFESKKLHCLNPATDVCNRFRRLYNTIQMFWVSTGLKK